MSTPANGLAQSSRTPEKTGQAIPQPSFPSSLLWFGSLGEGKGSPSPTHEPQESWGLGRSCLEGAGTQGGGECAIGAAIWAHIRQAS